MFVNNFRWLLFGLWTLGAIAIGALIGDFLAWFDKPWSDLSLAISVTVLGLIGAWILAPYNKHIAVMGFLIFGLVIAVFTGPSIYPDWHANARQSTYLPVISAAGIGVVVISILLYGSKKRG